ncbi:hypothetical protein RJ55_03440 [Drechmeria coniospora]|nr:hypothetical protein RJ55_03440 [Drechmeria coniospora]
MRPVRNPVAGEASRGSPPDAGLGRTHLTPLPPVSCFVTTEASLDSATDPDEPGESVKSYANKRSRSSGLLRPDRTGRRQRRATPSLPSDVDHGASKRTTTDFTAVSGPGSTVSFPSSPELSSTCPSDDPNSNTPSFAELSPTRSPCPEAAGSVAGDAVLQFVMPSLTVPPRRPFTEIGKALGKLKILVAGPAGIGKTALILSVAQCCDHIVHMDAISHSPGGSIAEVPASTRPHLWWRAGLDSSTQLEGRRFSSATDEILDRNLCFVDCRVDDQSEATRPDIRYVESQLFRLCEKSLEEADLYHILSGGAGSIVDVVLYMIPHAGPTPDDVGTMRILQGMTNVIPLLARVDELGHGEIPSSKHRLKTCLGDTYSACFSFTSPGSAQDLSDMYAVSSDTRDSHETMEASILMSSSYLPPLVPTELQPLVERIFSLEGSSLLRHSAAVKSVNWRRRYLEEEGNSWQSALTCRNLPRHGVVARYPAATAQAERQCWGRIELASWAEALRQSLAAESVGRSRDGLGSVASRREMPLANAGTGTGRRSRQIRRQDKTRPAMTSRQDPLGLLELVARIKYHGELTLELLGSLGGLGCVAAWLIRSELAHHWDVRLPPAWCLTAR